MLALAAPFAYETNPKLILPCLSAQSGVHA
ncbi:hypothetical protein OKW42_005809 [Paraburkholderia sp. WC7.3d]